MPPNQKRGGPVLDPACALIEADLDEIFAVRRGMRKQGYEPLAIHGPWSLACPPGAAGKAPIGAGWQNGQKPWRLFRRDAVWSYVASNTGLLLGFGTYPVQALDFDINDNDAMEAARTVARSFLPLAALVRYRDNSPRIAVIVRCEAGAAKERLQGERGAVERLALGQQVVVHGIHASGAKLLWRGGRSPWSVDVRDLPLIDESQVAELFNAIAQSGALGSKLDRTSAKDRKPKCAGGHGIGPDESIAAELREMIASEGNVVQGVRAFIRTVGVRGSYRHDSLVVLAGHLVARGWPEEQATKLMLPAINAAFGEGCWRREVQAALQHAAKRHSTRAECDFEQVIG